MGRVTQDVVTLYNWIKGGRDRIHYTSMFLISLCLGRPNKMSQTVKEEKRTMSLSREGRVNYSRGGGKGGRRETGNELNDMSDL